MSLRVVRPGSLTSVQDLGRYGLQHLGIVPGGAMDPVAHRVANALVGNPPEAATLECTVLGPNLLVEGDMLIALYGATFEAKVAGLPWPRNRPLLVKAGTRLKIGAAAHGARAYLAVAGGLQVSQVLGSRSTYIPASFGGLSGRAVKAGDRLPCSTDVTALSRARFERIVHGRSAAEHDEWRSARWFVPDLTLPSDSAQVVRAMAGRHHGQFDNASRSAFFAHEWRVAPDSNRMGFRLQGPRLARAKAADILSEPTCLGTVQVPNDGAPIALMADHQTTGGYPKIAEIAGADIPMLAQLAPGGRVRFVKCSLEQAAAARLAADARLDAVLRALESIFT